MPKVIEVKTPAQCPFNESGICIKCSKGNWVLKCDGNEIPKECPLSEATHDVKAKHEKIKKPVADTGNKKQRKQRYEPALTQKEMARVVNKILKENYYLPRKTKKHPSPFSVFEQAEHIEFKKKSAKTYSTTVKGLRAGTVIESSNGNHQKTVLITPRCGKRFLVNYAKTHPLEK